MNRRSFLVGIAALVTLSVAKWESMPMWFVSADMEEGRHVQVFLNDKDFGKFTWGAYVPQEAGKTGWGYIEVWHNNGRHIFSPTNDMNVPRHKLYGWVRWEPIEVTT